MAVSSTMKKVLTSEISRPYQGFERFMTFLPNPDEVLQREDKSIYSAMMKDAHIFGAVQQRKSYVLSKDWNISPASNDATDTKIAEYVQETVEKELNMYQDLEDLLRAFEHGYAVSEAIWRDDVEGITLDGLLPRQWHRFGFKPDGTLLLIDNGPQVELTMPYKFIVHRNEPEPENPYGTSVLSRCYWPWKFKQAGWEFWIRVLDKFGVPSLAALFEGDMNEVATLERAERISDELLKVASGSAGAFGGVTDIKAIDAQGSGDDFKVFLSMCDSQISKAVLTVTLTTEVSEKGSYSLGQIHEQALKQLTYKDCNALAATITRTVMKWIAELRFGIGVAGPEFTFDFFEAAPLETVMLAVDRGVPVSKRALYSTYNIPEPEGDDDAFISTKAMQPKEPQPGGDVQMSDDFFFSEKAPTAIEAQEIANVTEVESYWIDMLEPVADAWDDYLLSVLPKIDRIESPPEVLSLALEEAIYRTIMISWLMGRMHVQESAPKSMNFRDEIPDEIELPHEEAIEYLKSRTSMPRDAFYDLEAAGRFRAFTVAKVSSMDAIEETKKRLLASLAEGQSMAQFIQSARASEVIQKGGFSKSTPWYWETVFRTNSIAAWNGGRFQQYREVSDSIQDLQYISILDRRTSDICRAYNGITRPATDSIWQRITPPNHFNCRSTITAIWKGTMEAKRTARSTDEDVANLPIPDDGFDSSIMDVKDFFNVPLGVMQKAMEYGLFEDISKKRDELK